jgi:hypothetical protein
VARGQPLRRRRGWCGWLLAALLFAGDAPATAAPAAREYELKAVFLFNFTQFVDWPSDSFAGPQSPLVICVLGDDPYGGFLDDTVRGETVGGHPLAVERYRHVEDVARCHVLFISASEAMQMTDIVQRLRGRSILTVSNAADSDTRGSVVRFATESNRIKLRIDMQAARAAHLEISSKLLRAAEIVGADGG